MMRRLFICLTWLCLFHLSTPASAESLIPVEHQRGPEQTFLTFPEWYLVHSQAEYAAYLHNGPPSQFPLFAHIAQFWQAYRQVTAATSAYPFNGGYHLMVMVIGTSTTVEYGLKGLYERTLGRLSEALTDTGSRTPEDRFAATTAQQYVDFIRVDPWYLFDFASRLKALWSDVPLSGPNLMRRWERRYALTCEYLVKELYARLIKLGTHSIYEAPKPVTAITLNKAPTVNPSQLPELNVLSSHADGRTVATMPRYEAFTPYASALAAQGLEFVEIAGNDGPVLVSLLVPTTWRPALSAATVLFEQDILTRPGQKRAVLALPVARLADLLRGAGGAVKIEHVYDY